MARYNEGTTYNSGARYGVEEPRKRNMSQIRLGLSRLTIEQKLTLGQNIITASTSNPNVPGNTAVLAAFSTTQTALEDKLAAAVAARSTSKTCTTEQDDAEALWDDKLVALASFTQSATGGNAAKIESAGFGVRGTPTPVPLPEQVMSLNVMLNGSPGHSKLNWEGVSGADGYLVQGSPDPITATGWTQSIVSTKTTFLGNGATAGQKYWFRVAAFNARGQGPWSEPASRPVM